MTGHFDNYFTIHARYNRKFNEDLRPFLTDIAEPDRDAIFVQLNHIYVMDRIWLSRFAGGGQPFPHTMDARLFGDVSGWWPVRSVADDEIEDIVTGLTPERARSSLFFATRGDNVRVECTFGAALVNLFNHQSLHRGEILQILSRAGVNFGNSDILPLIVRAL